MYTWIGWSVLYRSHIEGDAELAKCLLAGVPVDVTVPLQTERLDRQLPRLRRIFCSTADVGTCPAGSVLCTATCAVIESSNSEENRTARWAEHCSPLLLHVVFCV